MSSIEQAVDDEFVVTEVELKLNEVANKIKQLRNPPGVSIRDPPELRAGGPFILQPRAQTSSAPPPSRPLEIEHCCITRLFSSAAN